MNSLWLKGVPEGVDESGGGLVGEGVDLREDDKGVDPVLAYETDEDEFLDNLDSSPAVATDGPDTRLSGGPGRIENTAKRLRSARRIDTIGYDLAYFNLWWSRMAIEGRKEAKENIKKEEEAVLGMKMRKIKIIKRKIGKEVERKKMEFDSTRNPTSDVLRQFRKDLRGGQPLEGGTEIEGEERGSPVSVHVIFEQPQVLSTDVKILDTVPDNSDFNI